MRNLWFNFAKKPFMSLWEIYKKGKKNLIIPHIIFWLFSIVLFTVVLFYTRDFRLSKIDLATASNVLVTIILLCISVYINLLWLIPSFFMKRKYLLFFILQMSNIFLFILLNFWVSSWFEGNGHPNFTTEIVAEFILILIFLVITTLLKFTRDSITLQDVELKMKEVEKQKIEAELKVLKAQVNPHFFFNTLNSLYALTLDKSEKAPELILKLSELMRYVIYEAKEDVIPIRRQLEFLQNYVYLENLRAGESLKVNMQIRGQHTEVKIDPLLFIVFIENAFKHGLKVAEQMPYIDISFDLSNENKVLFFIQNNKEEYHGGKRLGQGGIGLENAKKRLQMLYPGKHDLKISETDDTYRVDLSISIT